MASLGHVAAGVAAARIYHQGRVPPLSSQAAWAMLSLLPDVDVIGFALGVQYAAPWGHRGATHSLAMALLIGAGAGLLARRSARPSPRTWLIATAVLISHPLLDMLTDGGLGCALLWPFRLTRYFLPWRPIPVAPIGRDFVSLDGVLVALAELVMFAPVLAFGWWRGSLKSKAFGIAASVWLACAWLLATGDTSRDAITGFVLRDDTQYADRFSEAAFRAVTPGQSQDDVETGLGPPYRTYWFYTAPDGRPPDERPAPQEQTCLMLAFDRGVVSSARDVGACAARGVHAGDDPGRVTGQLGPPLESCWQYSWSPGGTRHRVRIVCFANGVVHLVVRKWS